MSGEVLRTQYWRDDNPSPLSLEAIRERHHPPQAFRVSPMRYPPGTRFGGLSRAGRVYVLAGECRYAWGAETIEIRAGEYLDFSDGSYDFEVVSEIDVELVNVWDLGALLKSL